MEIAATERHSSPAGRRNPAIKTKYFYRLNQRFRNGRRQALHKVLRAIAPGHRPLDEFSAAKLDDLGLPRSAVGIPDNRDLHAIGLRP